MALMHVCGELAEGETFAHLSILDTQFICRIEAPTAVGGTEAVITRLGGRAWLTGLSYYGSDPEGPFPQGYRLNDTWLSC
jgi:proline racemase